MSERSLGEVLAQAENPEFVRTATARVLLRQDLVARHSQLETELTVARANDYTTNDPDRAPAIAQQIADLEAEMQAETVEFKFAAIGKKAWADLLAANPPTKEQLADELSRAKASGTKPRLLDMNPETFPIAAIAASCKQPAGVDEAAVKRLEAALTDAQFTALWMACIEANIGGGDVPKSLAAGQILRVNGQSATSVSAAAATSAALNS